MSIRECVRCEAQTLKGVRCKKRTCIYSKFCNVHTKKLFNLYVKKSHIDGAGTGLYTSKMIPTNTRTSQYTGELKRFDPDNISTYDFGIPGGMVIDASSTQAGIARYTNDCRAENKRKKECKGSNTKFSESTRNGQTTVWLVSTKRIQAGSELFVSYGRAYWRTTVPRRTPSEPPSSTQMRTLLNDVGLTGRPVL